VSDGASRPPTDVPARFLASPTAVLVAVMTAVVVFGIGLTSPIWFMLAGLGPLEALHAGTPIVTSTIIGLIVMVVLGLVGQRLRRPEAEEAEQPAVPDPFVERRKHLIVHVVTILMFVVPFLTILVGVVLHQLVAGSPLFPS